MSQHSDAENGTYATVHFLTVHYKMVCYRMVHYRTVHYRTVRYRTVCYRTVRYRTVRYRMVRYRAVNCKQYSVTKWYRYKTVQSLKALHLTKQFVTKMVLLQEGKLQNSIQTLG